MDCDVVVIGAGAAGMIAARELARAGRAVTLLEARERVGGRMYGLSEPQALAPIELGAEFVHGRPAVTYRLLHEYGATVIDDAEVSFVARNGTLRPSREERSQAAGRILAHALETEQDQSVEQLIARYKNEAPDARAYVRQLVTGFDAADPALASARAIAREWVGDASFDAAQGRPTGGYGGLVGHLRRALEAERVDLRLRTIVTHVSYASGRVRVSARRENGTLSFAARCVLVTVPHGVLRAEPDEEGAIAFDPPLPAATLDAIERIAMGPVIKVVLRFREAFWESLDAGAWRDAAFVIGDGAFRAIWTQLPVRANILVAWAGGPAAERLAQKTDEKRKQLALSCAGRYFGDAAAADRAFEDAYLHDWQRDPFARGAYTYVLVGGEGSRRTLSAPIDERLWFAGEATADGAEAGTVAGALGSGLRAAREILTATA